MKKIALCIVFCMLLSGCTAGKVAIKKISGKDVKNTAVQSETLKIHSFNPDTLQPLYTKNNTNLQMLKLIFEPLFICDEEQRPLPVLADNYSVSDNGLAWTVNLKKNILWHDGSAFTSYDVENTFNTVLDIGQDCVFYPNLQNINNIICISDYTIVFNLKSPQTNFVNLLEVPIVKDTSKDTIKPIGTGPYTYAYRENKSIYLTANEKYRNGVPKIKHIEVKLLPDKNTSFFSFEAKAIDVVTTNMLNWNRYTSNSENKIIEYPSGSFNFLYLNRENEFLSKNKIRQAVSHSINKRRINSEVLLSHGAVTDSIFSPNWWMYSDSYAFYQYDVKSAIEKINEANKDKKKITLRLLVNNDNDIKFNVAGIIKDCLEDAGIEVKPEFVPWDEFLKRIEEKDYDMYLGEVNYSPEVNPEFLLKDTKIYNPILNELQRQVTDDGRKQKYYQLQQLVAKDIPLIPLYFDVEALFCSNKITGEIRPLRDNSFYNIAKWSIKEE